MKIEPRNGLHYERCLEVPFIFQVLDKFWGTCYCDKSILNVGIGNYENELRDRQATIKTCDFKDSDFKGDFVTVPIEEKFDCILFVSTLDHFNHKDLNYPDCQHETRAIIKARQLLKPAGFIIVTLPYGKEEFSPDHIRGFINWSERMKWKVLYGSGARVFLECFWKTTNMGWVETDEKDLVDIGYTTNSTGARGLYCGVWI